MPKLELLVTHFVDGLSAAIEAEVIERARKRVAAVLTPRWGRRRTLPDAIALLGIRPRKKPPLQLCPVPGCQNAAAPIYGMVCAEHRHVAKTTIRQYREQRRAAKAKAAAAGAARSPAAVAGQTRSKSPGRQPPSKAAGSGP
jgi:hypothetical protein